jgi:hypothetical protein
MAGDPQESVSDNSLHFSWLIVLSKIKSIGIASGKSPAEASKQYQNQHEKTSFAKNIPCIILDYNKIISYYNIAQ